MSLVPPTLEYGLAPRDSAAKIFRRILVVALLAAAGVGIGASLGFLLAPKPIYRASAMLRIAAIPPGMMLPAGTRAMTASEIPATGKRIQDMLKSNTFRQHLADGLKSTLPAGTSPGVEEIARKVACVHLKDTSLFQFDATDGNRYMAASMADGAANSAIREFAGSAPSLQLVSVAGVPTRASNRRELYYLIGGLAGGVLLPLVVLFGRSA
jgi:hypothetical protein